MRYIVILLVVWCNNVLSQTSVTLLKNDTPNNRIEKLESQVARQRNLIDSLEIQLQEHNQSLADAKKINKISEEVYSKTKDSISMSDRIINLFIALIAFAITFSGVTVIQNFRYQKRLKREAQRKINELTRINEEQISIATKQLLVQKTQLIEKLASENEEALKKEKDALQHYATLKIAEITQSNEETIKKLINKHNKELFLLQNSKILIINKEDTKRDQGLEMILKRFESSLEFVDTINLINNIKIEELKKYDAVILDNINYEDETKNWNFTKEHFDNLIAIVKETCINNSAFLFFGRNDGGIANKLPEYAHLINFANQSATLFANLIDLLDYRRLLKSR